jgi:hypothetical protein
MICRPASLRPPGVGDRNLALGKGPKKKVMGLLANLKRRGWWKQEEEEDFDPPEWEAGQDLAHPHDL